MGDDSFSGEGFALRKGSRQDPGALEMSLGTALRARCAAIGVRRWHVERDVRRSASAGGTSSAMCGSRRPPVARRARCAAAGARRWHVGADVRQPAYADGTSGPMCGPNAPISFSHRHFSAQRKRTSPLFDLIFLALRAPHAIASPQISHIAVEVPIWSTSPPLLRQNRVSEAARHRKPQGTWDRKAPEAARHLGSQDAGSRKAPGTARRLGSQGTGSRQAPEPPKDSRTLAKSKPRIHPARPSAARCQPPNPRQLPAAR